MTIIIEINRGKYKENLELKLATNLAFHSLLGDIPNGELHLTERIRGAVEKFLADHSKGLDT